MTSHDAPDPIETASAPPSLSAPESDAILRIMAKETGVERHRLVPYARIADLEIPSLDMVQAIFELETHFDVEIPVVADRTGGEFETVGDLVEHVQATIDRARRKPGATA